MKWIVGLLGKGAGALGVNLTPFAFFAGLALGAASAGAAAGWGAYKIGRALGDEAGFARCMHVADVNKLKRDLAEAHQDLAAAQLAAENTAENARRNAAAAMMAQGERDAYREELEKRGPARACAATDGDVRWLWKDHFRRGPVGSDGRPAPAPPRRPSGL